MTEIFQVVQMTPYELENLIEKVLHRVLKRYVKEDSSSTTEPQRPASKIMSIDDVCKLTGYAKGYVYKLTSSGIIPHSKPNGKAIYFDREEVENWLLSAKVKSFKEKDIEAATYITS